MEIRRAEERDIDKLMEIYRHAKEYMDANGNPNQWVDGYPKRELILKDIANGNSFVCIDNGRVCGVFAFIIGEDPTYQIIEEGAWLNDAPYGTIHRIGSDGSVNGIFHHIFEFCKNRSPVLRIDTYEDNHTMRHLIEKAGFTYCGIIYSTNNTPRLAYQYQSNSMH